MRAGNWKLQIDGKQNKAWLFDLASDPTEQNNLSDARPDKLAALTSLINTHYEDARMPLYPYTLENPVLIDKTLADDYKAGDEYAWWPN